MNCKEAMRLIDTLSFVDYDPQQLGALEHHLRQCEACRQALATQKELDSELARTCDLPAPKDLAVNVLLRIADHESTKANVARLKQPAGRSVKAAWAWALLLVGTVIGVGAQVSDLVARDWGSWFGSLTPRRGLESFLSEAATGPTTWLLAIGLLLYVTGLFALNDGRNHRDAASR